MESPIENKSASTTEATEEKKADKEETKSLEDKTEPVNDSTEPDSKEESTEETKTPSVSISQVTLQSNLACYCPQVGNTSKAESEALISDTESVGEPENAKV